MSISTLESRTSLRMLDQQSRWIERCVRAEQAMVEDFVEATTKPLHLPAAFVPYELFRRDGKRPSMSEVLSDTLDYDDFTQRAIAILCDTANGKEGARVDAKELLEAMAIRFASMNAHLEVE